jgi:hypothetical protein
MLCAHAAEAGNGDVELCIEHYEDGFWGNEEGRYVQKKCRFLFKELGIGLYIL